MASNLGGPSDTKQSHVGSFRPLFEIWNIHNFLESDCDRLSSFVPDNDINVTDSLDLIVYSADVLDYRCHEVSEVIEVSGAVSACSTIDNPGGLRDSCRLGTRYSTQMYSFVTLGTKS